MKLKDLLLEAEIEASVEDALDQVTSDLAKADIDENNTTNDSMIALVFLTNFFISIAKVQSKTQIFC